MHYVHKIHAHSRVQRDQHNQSLHGIPCNCMQFKLNWGMHMQNVWQRKRICERLRDLESADCGRKSIDAVPVFSVQLNETAFLCNQKLELVNSTVVTVPYLASVTI